LTDSGKFVSPLQLARALGLGESTVKRWIDQGRVPARKTPGGHRRIPLHAALGYVREAGLTLVDPAALGLLLGGEATPEALRDLLAAGRPHAAISLLERVYAGGMSAAELADDWIAPAMESIGHGWETGDIPVTREHSASAIATRALHALLRTCGPGTDRPLAFVAGLSGDPYVLAGLCAELTLCEVGYRAVNFGADTPLDSLANAVEHDAPALVALSLSTPLSAASSSPLRARFAEAVREAGSALILGGRGMRPELVDELGATAWCRSMRELQRLAEHLRAASRSLSAAV
jgi:excisionase family DNA binding protein